MWIRLGLFLLHLLDRYPCASACYDVLDIDLVEHEAQARVEMEWCLNRFSRYYDRREGDTFGYSCLSAQLDLDFPKRLREKSKEFHTSYLLMREIAQERVDSKWCRPCGEELRRYFEEELAKQTAIYACMNAEDEINYGPLGMGPYRKKDVDLECWHGGWKKFYVKST